ncbi:MAG: VCBS repeat-containing protein [Gemmatimonadota bacterium]|nr:MAG: VCBS repeat-containing protein [Gemmatimonadota bacterium]
MKITSLVLIIAVGIMISANAQIFENQVSTSGKDNTALTTETRLSSQMASLHIPFIANDGQYDEQVAYSARTFGGTVFITHDGDIVYALQHVQRDNTLSGVALREQFVRFSRFRITGENLSNATINSFTGNDRSMRTRNIPAYDLVNLGEVYEGIIVKLKAHGNNVEKLFCVQPWADPGDIRVELSGGDGLRVNPAGELEAMTPHGTVSFTKPIAYQEAFGQRFFVEVAYRVHGNEYGFSVGNYNPELPLIIDPLLASTFLGGSGDEVAWPSAGLAVDGEGNIYVAATTYSADFPATTGTYMIDHQGGNTDVVLCKFDGDLSTLLAATYLGGNSDDGTPFIAIDGDGNIFVTGETSSSDFPTTPGAFRETRPGLVDVFVAKFSNDLTTLLASTYLGGSVRDDHAKIAADDLGHVFVTGRTQSSNFPVTEGAFDESHNPGYDVFLSKLSNDLTTLHASTFLGPGCADDRPAIDLDHDGNPVVTGTTESFSFPTTPGAYQESFGGQLDIYVAKLNDDLSALVASTFIGSASFEMGYGVAVSSDNSVFVTSHPTASYPTTPGAYQTTFGGGVADAGVAKLDADLTTLVASTYIGGNANDAAISVALDNDGNVLVSGYTDSPDFPVTPSAIDPDYNGSDDGFVAKLSPDLSTLLTSTFLGGSASDDANAVTINDEGTIIISGSTASTNFPTTSGAYDESQNGGRDVFVALLDFSPFTRVTDGVVVTDGGLSVGACWVDYDGDDLPDLYVVNDGNDEISRNNFLYHNEGDGTFTRVHDQPMANDGASSYGASWADYDNDGDIDVVLANFKGYANVLYVNDGFGHFTADVANPISQDAAGSTSPSWIDYDLDGDLDLFIANSSNDLDEYPPFENFLYRNDEGTFTRITTGDLVTLARHTYGNCWGDYDSDGDPDLVNSNNMPEPLDLFRNDGSGTFTRLPTDVFGSVSANGGGAAWADYDNDGDLDLFVANFWPGPSFLYRNDGDGSLTNLIGHGLGLVSGRANGGAWADYDNDGDQDIFVWLNDYEVPANALGYLFVNNGDGSFTRLSPASFECDACRGNTAVWGDYDRDGDQDLFVARAMWELGHTDNLLFRNNTSGNHWLVVKPTGVLSNRSAIGAKVRVKATLGGSPVWQMRELRSQTGAHAQSPLETHFGLGDATIIDSIRIEWPSGMVDILTDVNVDQFLVVTEGEFGDLDGDGIADIIDNCPNNPNPDQEDNDADGAGDICDNCPDDANPDQADADSDNTGDACDLCTDTDGDEYGDPGYPANTCQEDNCPTVHNPDQAQAEQGNINCDGGINVLDVLATINHILGITPLVGAPLDRADCNGDGGVNILDALGIINVILGTGECEPTTAKPVLTSKVIQFCESLESSLTPEQFSRFMALVRGESQTPAEYALSQNYPNPFNPYTEIRYQIPDVRLPAHTTLKIFNTLGQEIRRLVDEPQETGYYTVTWDGRDEHGHPVSSGVYFYQIVAEDFYKTRKMLLLK